MSLEIWLWYGGLFEVRRNIKMTMEEVNGIVMFAKRHRERDYLVKIFTEAHGPVMFFVRGSKNPNWQFKPITQPLTYGRLECDLRKDGLSFIRALKEVRQPKVVNQDIMKNAYLIYILALIDASLEDRTPYPSLFRESVRAVVAVEAGADAELITHGFELKLLHLLGVAQEWRGCVVGGELDGPFDYSSKYKGLLCKDHWYLDERRFHLDQKTVSLLQLLSSVSVAQLHDVQASSATRKRLRYTIDTIYEENVGMHLKSKHFIDQMQKFED